jgi:thymidine phosphorylase
MVAGTFFLVVGASGAGKDTLLDGARRHLADDDRFVFARRVITRPADAGGEHHMSVSPAEFARRRDAGDFLAHWSANGLDYGLPIAIGGELSRGRHVVANGSRAAAAEIAARIENTVVIEITAAPELIAQRLAARGRETLEAVAARLVRVTPPFPERVEVIRVANDADPESGVAKLVAALLTNAGRG